MTLRMWVASGLLLVAPLLVDRPAAADTGNDPAVDRQGSRIVLRGDRQWHYAFAAVYRRLDRVSVHLEDLEPRHAGRRLLVVLQRQPPIGEARHKAVVLHERLPHRDDAENGVANDSANRTDGAGMTARGDVRLGAPGAQLPVGRYRVKAWVERERRYEPIADKPLFVIFNAHHPADRGVHHPHAPDWLEPTLNIVQLTAGKLTAEQWRLDIHDPEVFELAMSLADGARTGVEAAESLVTGACGEVEGHWPQLADIDGRVPASAPPVDPQWHAGGIQAATERLNSNDTRGQCFDYAMIYVALLRSVGVPARTVTAIDPAPMPHPDAPRREVQWDYHVWAEVFLEGQWWASDVTYLDQPLRDRLPRRVYPGLQRPHDPWFARMIGPRTQLWAVERSFLRDVSGRYGALTANTDRQLTRHRVGR